VAVDRLVPLDPGEDYDAVLFLGGHPPMASDYVAVHEHRETASRLIQAAKRRGLLLAGLCGGNAVLAEAGALRGEDVSRSVSVLDCLERNGVGRLIDRPAVVSKDGAILTGRDPSAAWALAAALVERLRERGVVR
jgi:putative intracellular protease/amidase